MTFSQAQLQAAESFISKNPPQDSTIPREVWLVAAAMQESTPQWQPIETAPDETDVLVCRREALMAFPPIIAGRFDGNWYEELAPNKKVEHLTHWMPLPGHPSSSSDPKRQSK